MSLSFCMNIHCTCTCIDVPLHKNWNTLLNPLQINFWWLCWNHQIYLSEDIVFYILALWNYCMPLWFFFHKIFPVLYTCTSIWYEDLRLLSFFLFEEISEAHAWHKGCPGDLRCVMTHSNAIDKGHINMACILRPCKG